jgi:hypothetical protein
VVARVFTFNRLKYMSFAHSAIYLGLLVVWMIPELHFAKFVLGMTHGLGWIAMALIMVFATRSGVVSLWLAVMVAVIGGLGPFAGSAGFVWEQHRNGKTPRKIKKPAEIRYGLRQFK